MINVLIVDDDPRLRGIVREFLELTGQYYAITEASDGVEAVALAQEIAADVVLMDICMPKMDGVEATKRIKALGLASEIIICTGADSSPVLEDARLAGARHIMVKPIDLLELLTCIQQLHG